MQLKVLDLFSGIGGFSLGLERAGMKTVAFCEIEKYPRQILRKHWPNVPIFEDIKELHATDLPETIDVICGGFPCQPFSVAGKRRGASDDRALWPELFRLICECHPKYCICENVPGIINMGLDKVLADLGSEGYEVEVFNIPACSVNAPHRRDRVWIVANDRSQRTQCLPTLDENKEGRTELRIEFSWGDDFKGIVAHSEGERERGIERNIRETERRPGSALLQRVGCTSKGDAADTQLPRSHQQNRDASEPCGNREDNRVSERDGGDAPDANVHREIGNQSEYRQGCRLEQNDHFEPTDFGRITTIEWLLECTFCRGDARLSCGLDGAIIPGVTSDKVPNRVARLKALGNSVVPFIPEIIGRAIIETERTP